jgi:UDP-N-acetylglucosamine--N-acetylmuramyl-(pentapeptide) pyrophosphoryl-undecaprenol N-acetylglucosamine transferase
MSALVLIAAGGTGGHLFPAEALARALVGRGHRVALAVDVRAKGFGERLEGVSTHVISAGGLTGASLPRRARSMVNLARGWWQARGLIRKLKPAVAVGFGGYASVPAVFAAQQAGLPTLLHEQNAVLGRANRLLARRARHLALSFPAEAMRGLPSGTPTTLTGNPVRPAIVALRIKDYVPATANGPMSLLVLGGSLGARIFGRVVPEAVEGLADAPRRRLRIAQQCRQEDLERVRAHYDRLAVEAELAAFFDDVPERYAAAHLVIARAGASTVAELAMIGRPAILVPYAHAADDHQSANAQTYAAMGAAWPIGERDFTGALLARRLAEFMAEPDRLSAAAATARAQGRPDAAERLADAVQRLLPACPREAGA